MALDLKNQYPPLQLGRREPYLLERCKGRVVMDLGFVDVGLAEEKAQAGALLHQWICKVAKMVVGVDIDASYRHLLPPETDTYRLCFGNVEDPATFDPVRDVEFDVIVAGEILEHLNNPGLFLWAIRGVMRPSTTLIVTVPNGLRFQNLFNGRTGVEMVHPDHNYWYSPTTIQTLLNKNGFHVEFLRGYNYGAETAEQLGPYGLACPGLIAEATICAAGETPRRWPRQADGSASAPKAFTTWAAPHGSASSSAEPAASVQVIPRIPVAAGGGSTAAAHAGPPAPERSHSKASAAAPHTPQPVSASTYGDAAPSGGRVRLETFAPRSDSDPRPRVLCITDRLNWAYDHIARALKTHLGRRYNIISLPYNYFPAIGAERLRAIVDLADVVYCFSGVMSDESYDLLGARPMVVGIHNDYQLTHYADKLTAERLARFVAVGCLNENIAKRVIERKLHERVVVTLNGVDEERFQPRPNARNGAEFRVGWVGFIGHSGRRVKRFEELVVPSCAAAGAPLLAAVNEINAIPHDKMPQFYELVDALLVASIGEGTSGPLLEAAASGLVPISTRVGSAERLIEDGVNGFLVDGTVKSIASRLHWLRENPDERRRMGAAARQTILESWRWSQRAGDYAALFDLALEEGGAFAAKPMMTAAVANSPAITKASSAGARSNSPAIERLTA